MRKLVRLLASLVLLALIAASCASQSEVSDAAPTPAVEEQTTAAPSPTTHSEAAESTSTTEARNTAPLLTSYEFPAGLVDDQPTLMQGVVGVPDGPGPFPVAMVMHGAHPACVDDFAPETFSDGIITQTVEFLCGVEFPEYIRHDVGLSYIVAALNNAGVAAVAIDVKATYVWWGGEPYEFGVLAQLVNAHHEVLQRLNDGDDLGLGLSAVEGRLNLDEISLVGHSRSGGYVLPLIASDTALSFSPRAGVLLQPDGVYVDNNLPELPILLVRGECDEDVGPEAGVLELTDLVAGTNAPVGDLFVSAAGHRMLNTGLNGSTCPERGDRSTIAAQVAQGIASFVASDGGSIDLLHDSDAQFTNLGGQLVEQIPVDRSSRFDPHTVPFASSTVELLPPVPDGADYSDALDEDF